MPRAGIVLLQQFVATNRFGPRIRGAAGHADSLHIEANGLVQLLAHATITMRVADLLVSRLARAGARAIFGMPGGGSNLDIIEAARRQGLRFVLAHTETAGALMAAAQAEITGAPGVCLSTLGPGAASLVNGVAHAWLDRVPLVVLTDAVPPAARQRFEHQNLA